MDGALVMSSLILYQSTRCLKSPLLLNLEILLVLALLLYIGDNMLHENKGDNTLRDDYIHVVPLSIVDSSHH